MKAPLILLALAGAALAGPAMTDRITPEEIAARQKSATPLAVIPQSAVPVEGEVSRPGEQSLLSQSDILNDGIHWTLVPKGAVLHIPPPLATRVSAKPLGKLLPWSDFLRMNRNWLFTEEVTFDLAAGKAAFAPSRREAWHRTGKVVIAIHFGGPISVARTESPIASTK